MRYILLLSLCFFLPGAYAEPLNLAFHKKEIIAYHDSGQYQKEFTSVVSQAKTYLKKRMAQNAKAKHKQKLAIVLDIDETSLSNYQHMVERDFGGNLQTIHQEIALADGQAFQAMLSFYQYALKNKVAVFFVTGRSEKERAVTEQNLSQAGYTHYRQLILRPNDYHQNSIIGFKASARHAISQQGYTIVESIGDQMSDIRGGYAEKGFKLPNPFYYLP